MKDIPRFAATLTLVAIIAAGSLAWVNQITKPKIIAQQEKEFNNGLNYVLPGTESGIIEPVKEVGQSIYYAGYADKEKTQFIGYAFPVLSPAYSSTIQTLVGIDSTGKIIAIKVLSQKETPGLGTRCEEIHTGETVPWWQAQFSGKIVMDVAVDKDGGEIESITGATITSRAITDGIASTSDIIFQKIKVSQN